MAKKRKSSHEYTSKRVASNAGELLGKNKGSKKAKSAFASALSQTRNKGKKK